MADLKPNRYYKSARSGPDNCPAKAKGSNADKKLFDKKQYRIKKYSNNYKIEAWKEKKKKTLLNALRAEEKRTNKKFKKKPINFIHASNDEQEATNEEPKMKKKSKKKSGDNYKRELTREELERMEFDEEMNNVKKKFQEKQAQMYKTKKLFTKKGQPIMKHRLELMLEKIKMNQYTT